MIKRRGFPRVFFGWWTVLVTGLWTGFGQGFYGFGISVLFKPIATDLGLSRAAASMAAGIGRLEGGIESPVTGWLSDRFGPKWVIFTGAVIVAAGLALMYFINSLWTYILVWGVLIGIGTNLAFTLACDKAITNWFVKKRGLALGLRFVLMGVLTVIALPVVTWLVTAQGWRIANLIWSGVMFAGVPLLWLFVRQKRPEYYGLLPDGATVEEEATDTERMIDRGVEYAASFQEREFTLRQALKTWSYWLLTMSWAGGMMIQGAVTVHLIPFLTDTGIDPTVAGSMMATMVFFQIPARFLASFLGDRFRTGHLQFLLVGSFLFMAAGVAIVLLGQSIVMLYVFLVLYGFGSGAAILVRIMIEGRYFGRKAFATIHGITNMFSAPIAFLAPVYSGWVYDTTGSYTTVFIVLLPITVIAALLAYLIRPPAPPVGVSDVSKFM